MKGNGGSVAGTAALNAAAKQVHPKSTTRRRTPTDGALKMPARTFQPGLEGWHVVADALLVVARTGRSRFLLTYRCCCGARHVSYVRVLPAQTTRTTACGVRVVLHPVARLR